MFVPLDPRLTTTTAATPAQAIERVVSTHPRLPSGRVWLKVDHGLIEGPSGSGLLESRAAGDVLYQESGGMYQIALRHETRPAPGWVVVGVAPPDCLPDS
jgi:hypothetical protein